MKSLRFVNCAVIAAIGLMSTPTAVHAQDCLAAPPVIQCEPGFKIFAFECGTTCCVYCIPEESPGIVIPDPCEECPEPPPDGFQIFPEPGQCDPCEVALPTCWIEPVLIEICPDPVNEAVLMTFSGVGNKCEANPDLLVVCDEGTDVLYSVVESGLVVRAYGPGTIGITITPVCLAGRPYASLGASFTVPEYCLGDTNLDGTVDNADLQQVLADWGTCSGTGCCRGDVNGDGIVDVEDMLAVLSGWGACG